MGPEAKKRAAWRETAVTDVVAVSYRKCMPRTHSVFAGLAGSHPLSLKSRFTSLLMVHFHIRQVCQPYSKVTRGTGKGVC